LHRRQRKVPVGICQDAVLLAAGLNDYGRIEKRFAVAGIFDGSTDRGQRAVTGSLCGALAPKAKKQHC